MQYCGLCHQFPDPSLLDAKTWETGVLPAMGPRLGIFAYGFSRYPSSIGDSNIGKDFYPSQQVLPFIQWQNIIDYYSATSPEPLQQKEKYLPIEMNDKLFQPVAPLFNYNTAAVTFIQFEPGNKLMMCAALKKNLFVFNNSLQLIDSIPTNGSVTDLILDSNKITFCNTGILAPNNGKFGSIESISLADTTQRNILFNGLMRPVQINRTDLNNDGKQDFVVCEFGNLKGALSWLENKGNNGYSYYLIRAVPGAIATYINDYNHDGLPDIWALFSQGDEGIFLFANKGNGIFDMKEILQFHLLMVLRLSNWMTLIKTDFLILSIHAAIMQIIQ